MKALGIILAGGGSERMEILARRRAISAMPVAGAYRSVDFALSNMTNSNINTVAVVTQYSSRSLNEHLSAPSWWGFGRKQGGLFLLNPTITQENKSWYRGTGDALIQNLDFLKQRHEPYVIIASGDGVYKMDFNKVLDFHMERDAEITVVCTRLGENDDTTRFGVLELDDQQRIIKWSEKRLGAVGGYISCGIYVVRRRHLIRLLEDCKREEKYNFVQDVILRHVENRKTIAYIHDGYWCNIASVPSYYACNMDFLDPALRKEFFLEYPVIHSRVDDNPPAKFNEEAQVTNSLLGGGAIINGRVENSVIFKKVYVGNNSVVRGCILLDDVYVDDGVVLENCIVEKHVRIEAGSIIKGAPNDIRIITE